MKQKLIFLVGPTAIGKTQVACILAKKINAEIISCDSMQVYIGMDIITSKPGLGLRKMVPHHLTDIVSPAQEYNVSRYRKQALKKIKEIIAQDKTPLFVGGSGLYMSILIDGIFKDAPKDKSIREKLYKEAETQGNQCLYQRLKKIDPSSARKIHPHDTKRIIRALEVFESTGKPLSYLKRQRSGIDNKYRIKIFCLNMERKKLYKKIEERIDKMFTLGLVNEVKRLLRLRLSQTAAYAIGIKELKGYFAGLYDLGEAKRLMEHNTCLYAKRQLTWFRKDKRIIWIKVGVQDKPREVANRIFKELNANT